MRLSLLKRHFSRPNNGVSDIISAYKPVNNAQRITKLLECAVGALRDPTRADLVSQVGDLSSYHALKKIQAKMISDPTGRRVLRD